MTTAECAKQLYEREWKAQLEAEHPGQFVAIEPQSRSYCLGETFLSAALSAKHAHPDRTSFVIRIGRDAAFHIGAVSQ
jgi:hypothetical protein